MKGMKINEITNSQWDWVQNEPWR